MEDDKQSENDPKTQTEGTSSTEWNVVSHRKYIRKCSGTLVVGNCFGNLSIGGIGKFSIFSI